MDHPDVVARVGGDEFVVVAPDIEEADALKAAERIAQGVERAGRTVVDDGPPLAVSVGLAPFGAGETPDAGRLIAAADAAMYEAKRRGGGICASPPE